MARPPEFLVDLRDRERLVRVLGDYLPRGVCPVDQQPFPGMQRDVELVFILPGEDVLTRTGRTVQAPANESFLVRLDEPVDVDDVRARADAASELLHAPLSMEPGQAPPAGRHGRPPRTR